MKVFVRGRDGQHPRVIVVTKAEDERDWKSAYIPSAQVHMQTRSWPRCRHLSPSDSRSTVQRDIHPQVAIDDVGSLRIRRSNWSFRTRTVLCRICRRGKGLLIRNGQTTVRNIVLQLFLEDAVMR